MRKSLHCRAICLVLTGLLIISGCNDAENTALLGAAAGAGIGALAGGDSEAALIGAAVGGGAGYMIGNESDKKKQQQERESYQAQQNTVTVWITNSNGSKKPVTLQRSGPYYIGPQGEHYQSLPSEQQLAMVYGF